jgi:DNA-directed RNA polymerase
MEPNTSHEFANKPDLKLFQKKRLISFNSKMTLQEIILDIAEMFSKFPRFYFSVRLDVRGRIYCMPNYFNYQSNELAKALILFADPSVIKKIYTSCIDYLISYGVNSFGGKISKQYLNKKLG